MSLKTFHILIAEDDEDDLDLISLSFKKHVRFHKVEAVKNGVELMDHLHANRSALPDIVLTDLNMPKKDGYESLQEIYSDPDFSKIPVFVYSTTINPFYIMKCRNMGVMDFLLKPYKLQEIDEIPERVVTSLSKDPSASNDSEIPGHDAPSAHHFQETIKRDPTQNFQ